MLVLFLLCTFLQTLWGKPLPLPLAPGSGVTVNIAGVMASQQGPAAPADDGQPLRSVYDIVQSCLFTIIACVWTSIHPNINGPRDSWWTCMKRRVVTTFYAVIAPEMVLLWALKQRFGAKQIADKYNTEFKTLGETETSTWAKIKELFQPLPQSTTIRGASQRQRWTATHGFFIQMGGFILYKNEHPEEALTYRRLAELLRNGDIDAPTVTERELQDRSKGDTISKGVVVLQTLWFVLQCIVRAVQHLPLSELEVLTLAFAVLNTAIYAAWWGKPQGVDTAIPIPLKQVKESADNSALLPAISGPADNHHSNNKPLMQSNEDIGEEESWLGQVLRADYKYHSLPVFLIRLPYCIFFCFLRPLGKMLSLASTAMKRHRLGVSMFSAEYLSSDRFGPPVHIAFAIGLIFGAIHLLGWALEFPLLRDRTLWRASAVVMTVAPLVFLVADVVFLQDTLDGIAASVFYLFLAFVPFYMVARFVVIIIAFKAIVHPPRGVLLDISWTRHIPHF